MKTKEDVIKQFEAEKLDQFTSELLTLLNSDSKKALADGGNKAYIRVHRAFGTGVIRWLRTQETFKALGGKYGFKPSMLGNLVAFETGNFKMVLVHTRYSKTAPGFFTRRYDKHHKDPSQLSLAFEMPSPDATFGMLRFTYERSTRKGSFEERLAKIKNFDLLIPSQQKREIEFSIDLINHAPVEQKREKPMRSQSAKKIAPEGKSHIDEQIRKNRKRKGTGTDDATAA